MIRLAFLIGSPVRGAHGNAASRLALGLAESGKAEPTLVCYRNDPAPSWLPPAVRVHRLGVDRVSRSIPGSSVTFADQPDVLITRQVHANFVGLAASGWPGCARLARQTRPVQNHPIELSHASNWRDNKWLAKLSYRSPTGLSPLPRPCGRMSSAGAGWIRRRQRSSPTLSRVRTEPGFTTASLAGWRWPPRVREHLQYDAVEAARLAH